MARFGFDDQATLDRFDYRAPTPEQVAKMQRIRASFHETVAVLLAEAPSSADRTVALRALHEANMLANVCVMFPEE